MTNYGPTPEQWDGLKEALSIEELEAMDREQMEKETQLQQPIPNSVRQELVELAKGGTWKVPTKEETDARLAEMSKYPGWEESGYMTEEEWNTPHVAGLAPVADRALGLFAQAAQAVEADTVGNWVNTPGEIVSSAEPSLELGYVLPVQDLVKNQITDARLWAKAFIEQERVYELTEMDVTAWFANAMQTAENAWRNSHGGE